MPEQADLIAAIATSQGEGGIAIVRMSGLGAYQTLKRMFTPARAGALKPGRMRYGHVSGADGRALDEVMAVYFKAPRSYTREDVCEIHLHGGRACARAVLSRALELGARAAQPGEFTRRAFMNGRLDLAKAEAVMALTQAACESARRASVRQLTGGVSARIGEARRELISLLSLIGASVDFPEEVEEQAAAGEVRARAARVMETLRAQSDARNARMVLKGASVVLAGKPNVGKSSIMNALLHAERAIVTRVPGTTRDVLTEYVDIKGMRFALSDTAGVRDTLDEVESIGVERAKQALDNADCVILVLDASEPLTREDEALIKQADARYITVLNKCDLRPRARAEGVRVSAITGEGIDALADLIFQKAGAERIDDDALTAERHIACARRAIEALSRAIEGIDARAPLDFAASELDCALNALGEITGETLSENVIDEVFAKFCVGK